MKLFMNYVLSLIISDMPPRMSLMIGDKEIENKQTMNVLVVIFDSKLKWSHQINQAISKANKAKFASHT